MNVYAWTAIVCLALPVLLAVGLTVAWCWDRCQRHEPLVSPELRRLMWINTLQILACCLIGLAIGVVAYLGYTFQLGGGWR